MPRQAWGEVHRKKFQDWTGLAWNHEVTSEGAGLYHRRECCSRPSLVTTLTLKFLPEEK